MNGSPQLAALLQAFFTDRLLQQRQASPHTVAAYRDTFRLLLSYAHKALGKQPVALGVTDLQVPLITAFLQHIEVERHNSPRTRNVRLAAVHSFFRYVSFCAPECALLCQQILAIPSKRYDRKPIEYLSHDEIQALVAAPDTTTWIGRRDRVLLLLAAQTGLRVSELIGLRRRDIALDVGAHVQCCGKGRKLRATPLRPEAVKALRQWLRELPDEPQTPAFPSGRGTPLSRDAVERLVTRHARAAAAHCASLQHKRVTPHTLRHYLPFLTMSGNARVSEEMIGKRRSKRQGPQPITRHSFMELQAVEEVQQPVAGLIATRFALPWGHFGERLLLHGEGGFKVHLGGFDPFMAEP